MINSRGQAPLNFSADPQIQSLTNQLNTWLGLEQKYYNQWQCQLYGIAPNGSALQARQRPARPEQPPVL